MRMTKLELQCNCAILAAGYQTAIGGSAWSVTLPLQCHGVERLLLRCSRCRSRLLHQQPGCMSTVRCRCENLREVESPTTRAPRSVF